MRLQELINECRWELIEDIKESIYGGIEYACVSISTMDGYIDIHSRRNDDIEVLVYHDDNDHYSPRLEEYLAQQVDVDWTQIECEIEEEREDEWNEHGFADAEDYWRYRL